ncbi:MAG: DUF4258 domain-containing protein [Calditrichaceae bacterium]|nr:DUF4258 domain-containing protein [Calditrichaceae bacterium]
MADFKKIIFSNHAIKQMFTRKISVEDVKIALANENTIIEYPEDKPFPSKLVLGFVNNRPVHVIYSIDKENDAFIIITVYEPLNDIWEQDYLTRKK